jgi:xylan 1,4-beta-xylosidase
MRTVLLSLMAAVAAVSASKEGNATPPTVDASAIFNISTATGNDAVRFLWQECVGSSHAALALRADWRDQFRSAVADLGVKRVRFHGILDDDMSAFLGGGANMANVFSVMDFVQLETGVQDQILELSFMPEALAANDGDATIMHYKGITELPSNFTAWGEFLDQFFGLMAQRYPFQLKIEAWNEPNCGFLAGAGGTGCCDTAACGNQTAYFELYKSIAESVRRSAPGYLVGGPATAQTGWLDDFLSWAVGQGNAPVDFVTTHLYPTDPVVNQTSRTGWTDRIAWAAQIAGKYGKNLTITEWNSGLQSGISDTTLGSSFFAHAFVTSQSLPLNVDTLSFWTFSDVFEEQGFVSAPFHDGFGLKTIHGVPKPGWCVAQLLARHTATGLWVTPPQGGTKYSDSAANFGSLDIIASLSKGAMPSATVINYIPFALTPPATQNVTLRFQPVNHDAFVRISTVDSNGCNPISVWRAQGSPVYPSNVQIAQMLDAAVPTDVMMACVRSGPTSCDVTFQLEPYGVAHVAFV